MHPIKRREPDEKTWIGCCFTLVGALGSGIVLLGAISNLSSGWKTPPGRLLHTVAEMGILGILTAYVALFVLGLIVLGIEYFRKEP